LEQRLRERTEELQAQAEKLSVFNTLAVAISQSLDLKEVLYPALDKVLELTKVKAGWIVLFDGQGEGFELAAFRGLPEEVVHANVQRAWEQCVCGAILERSTLSTMCYVAPAQPPGISKRRDPFFVRACPSNPKTEFWAL